MSLMSFVVFVIESIVIKYMDIYGFHIVFAFAMITLIGCFSIF